MCKINKPVINVAATAARIKEYRIRAGYSVREIQNIFNFSSPEAVYAWEKGKYLPTIDNMIVIADVYGVTVDDFIVRDVIEVECDIQEVKSA
ncbi:XRE family transcriptional regulator [Treponema ruminis]|uniref:Transcriptional regulator with XRE-family HTH domain n=1 Tax=Treponema ruminis TaxID=744515 RepID=A0A7W8LMV3_9SPIR|nr:helix-turn-helix transcriptional regulator [Treponema ruminis]MBB5226790.1 transcriptional regulator with XRE-family HTH domain [Treponema ruminis]QSI01988.1 XRE family transcriptional regulator [Treponema ruminis]